MCKKFTAEHGYGWSFLVPNFEPHMQAFVHTIAPPVADLTRQIVEKP